MKLSLTSPTLVLASLSAVHAYGPHHQRAHAHAARVAADQHRARDWFNPMAEHYAPRQAATSAAAPPAASSTGAPVPGASSAVAGAPPGASSGAASGSVPVQTSIFTFSLQASNPTAVPLSSIVFGVPSAPTQNIPSTPAAGETPTGVQGAPPLPSVANPLSQTSYPPMDKIPDINSPEVQGWINDVKNSGVQIPGYTPNVAGGCPANAQAAADTSRCWWTCTTCHRDTDIVTCPDKNTWGLTYDDGPAPYTPDLLKFLDEKQLKSTFFVVGSRVVSFPAMLQYEYISGHQISVHTWSHPQLTTLTNEQIIAELGWTKKIIKDVLGVTPNSMRPPFGDIDDRVRAICKAMNLTPILWTSLGPGQSLDTHDFDIHGGLATVDEVLFNWQNIIGNVTQLNTGFIVLEHDLFQQSVEVATGYILPDALARGTFKIMPVTTCLNKPMWDSYLETNDNNTNPPALSASSAVTLTAGAPGSAQVTGASKNNALTLQPSMDLSIFSTLMLVGGGVMGIILG